MTSSCGTKLLSGDGECYRQTKQEFVIFLCETNFGYNLYIGMDSSLNLVRFNLVPFVYFPVCYDRKCVCLNAKNSPCIYFSSEVLSDTPFPLTGPMHDKRPRLFQHHLLMTLHNTSTPLKCVEICGTCINNSIPVTNLYLRFESVFATNF